MCHFKSLGAFLGSTLRESILGAIFQKPPSYYTVLDWTLEVNAIQKNMELRVDMAHLSFLCCCLLRSEQEENGILFHHLQALYISAFRSPQGADKHQCPCSLSMPVCAEGAILPGSAAPEDEAPSECLKYETQISTQSCRLPEWFISALIQRIINVICSWCSFQDQQSKPGMCMCVPVNLCKPQHWQDRKLLKKPKEPSKAAHLSSFFMIWEPHYSSSWQQNNWIFTAV